MAGSAASGRSSASTSRPLRESKMCRRNLRPNVVVGAPTEIVVLLRSKAVDGRVGDVDLPEIGRRRTKMIDVDEEMEKEIWRRISARLDAAVDDDFENVDRDDDDDDYDEEETMMVTNLLVVGDDDVVDLLFDDDDEDFLLVVVFVVVDRSLFDFR